MKVDYISNRCNLNCLIYSLYICRVCRGFPMMMYSLHDADRGLHYRGRDLIDRGNALREQRNWDKIALNCKHGGEKLETYRNVHHQ